MGHAGRRSSNIQKIPGNAELAAHALGDLVANIKRITSECLEVGTEFSMLMAHCQKYDLANTSSDLARVTGLSRPTIHNLEDNEHAPCLENLLRTAVSCEVSLAGLVCPDLWETTATGLKVEGRNVKFPNSEKRKAKSESFTTGIGLKSRFLRPMTRGQSKYPVGSRDLWVYASYSRGSVRSYEAAEQGRLNLPHW